MSQSKYLEVFVPGGSISHSEGGQIITEGIDNVDINTVTIEGKDTCYCLSRFKFQHQVAEVK